jgi:hypothetical protein
VKYSYLILAIVCTIGATLVIVDIAAGRLLRSKYPFSPYQSMMQMQDAYGPCKAHAPKGFDCIMVPIMVSEDYIKAQTNE